MSSAFPNWKRGLVVSLVGLAMSLPAFTGDLLHPTMTLADALENAWRLHPPAAGAAARLSQVDAARDAAGRLTPEPATISLGTRNDRFNQNAGQREYEFEVAAPLWLPGQKDAHREEADRQLDKVTAKDAAIRLALAGEVRELWWKLAAAKNAALLSGKRLETARALQADVARRYKVGDLSRIDANLAQSELQAAQSELIEAEMVLFDAEQDYRTLTGSTAPLTLVAEAPAANLAQEGVVLESHPLVAEAAAAVNSIRAQANVLDKSRRSAPELALRLVRERGDFHESYASSMGVKLTIPLSFGPQLRKEQLALQSESDQAEAELLRVRSQVLRQIGRAKLAWRTAQQTLAIAQERVDLTNDSLKLTEKAFALGESDLANLLRVRAAAFDAVALLEQQHVVSAACVSRLNQALGVLP